MDDSSDEETEIEYSAVLDTKTGQVSREYLQFSVPTSSLPDLPSLLSTSDLLDATAKEMLAEDVSMEAAEAEYAAPSDPSTTPQCGAHTEDTPGPCNASADGTKRGRSQVSGLYSTIDRAPWLMAD